MKILLIGATGQIGSAIANALSVTDNRITVLVRDRIKVSFPDTVEVLEHNQFGPDIFKESLKNIDHVIYGLGRPEQFLLDESYFYTVNYEMLKMFLNGMADSEVKSLTYISTYEMFQEKDGEIRETHELANIDQMTTYYRSMMKAFRLITEYVTDRGIQLTTIHPSAVYGGLNTGNGITNYIENLLNKKILKVPFIVRGRFPILHVDSLADTVIRSLGNPGPYIVSDQMTTLEEIARVLHTNADSYIPKIAPLSLAEAGATALEMIARLFRTTPIMARAQLNYVTRSLEPKPDKAIKELGWHPISLSEGIERMLKRAQKSAPNCSA